MKHVQKRLAVEGGGVGREGPASLSGGTAPRPARTMRSAFGNLLLLVWSLVFALLAGEVLTRMFAPQILFRYPRGMYVSDPLRGYRLTPGFQGRLTAPEYDTAFRVNGIGLREDREFAPKATDTTRILVVGDSFTAGVGVERSEAFEAILEAALQGELAPRGVQVIAGGVPSYSTREAAIYLKREGLRLEPDLVLLAFFVGNDIVDNARSTRNTVVNGDLTSGEPPSGVLPLWVRALLSRHSHLYHLVWPYQRRVLGDDKQERESGVRSIRVFARDEQAAAKEWRATDRWVARFGRVARSHGIPFAMMVIPERLQLDAKAWEGTVDRLGVARDAYDARQPARMVSRALGGWGVPVLDLADAMRADLYLPQDGHWTVQGNQVAAEQILAFLKQQHLVGPMRNRPAS